jgi:antitoxin component YwqK of YwqJK toxin-antitoxin module
MKYCFVFCCPLLFFSCSTNKEVEEGAIEMVIPATSILKSSDAITIQNDVVFYRDKKYSGYLYLMQPNNVDTALLEGYMEGLPHGLASKWYPNKKLMEQRMFLNGSKHGKQMAYWENGQTKFEFIAKEDVYEGEMKEWNMDGMLIHVANYKKGQEEGLQKLWYDNEKVRANYVMANGRRFGLLGTKNCMNVSDSIFNSK